MRQVVTFDAYGTLVDFELVPATLKTLQDRLDLDGLDVDKFLDNFRVMRFQAVLEAYRPYDEVLHSSLEKAMRLHGLEFRTSDGDALVEAVSGFGPFPEVPDALRALKSRYEIAIISNTNDDLIARNIERVGVDFDHVITAQQAGAYKPSRETFAYAHKTIGVDPSQVIHTAQGSAAASPDCPPRCTPPARARTSCSWRRARSAPVPRGATAACAPRASPSPPARRASATGSRAPASCTTPSARRWTSSRS
ncbi:2-haloacid dehalogenase [Streptomyces rapamycinicus]|uniref:2-haloacid dehalogenase n=1 Tax=Streptomyces rapamycinicus TaxID=1226757 RepID=A0ABR6M047_9ACTN|nr:2-haloacid dehalogenase [Streptomyces rapamycinicus]